MRPLAVLILVLGAIAALVFAITSISDSGAHAADPHLARPADDPPAPLRSPSDLIGTGGPSALSETSGASDEATRVAVPGGTGAFANSLAGTVVGPASEPIAGAKVSLIHQTNAHLSASIALIASDGEPRKPEREIQTDELGRFRFTSLAPGNDWTVVVVHPEYQRAEVGPFRIASEGGKDETIQLKQGFVIEGHVKDAASGLALAGAKITLENPILAYMPEMRKKGQPEIAAITDQDGYYAFSNVTPASQQLVRCALAGFASQMRANVTFLTVQSERLVIDFELEMGQQIAGRVLAPDRKGVAGVSIRALGFAQGGQIGSSAQTVSLENGEFLLEDLATGTYQLSVDAPGWDVNPGDLGPFDSGATDVEIPLHEAARILGRVVDAETGAPVQSFRLSLRQFNAQNPAWGPLIGKPADFGGRKDGSFVFKGIALLGTRSKDDQSLRYVMQAESRGYASTFSEPFQLEQGLETTDVVVRMTRGGTLLGRLVDRSSGEPVGGAKVSTHNNNHIDNELLAMFEALAPTATTKSEVLTDEQGYFEMELLTPGEYQVRIAKDGYKVFVQDNVRVGNGLSTNLDEIELSTGAKIAGQVYDAKGKAGAGFIVTLVPSDGQHYNTYTVRADADGSYEVLNIAAGSYKLSCKGPPDPSVSPFEGIIQSTRSTVEIIVDEGDSMIQELRIRDK